MSRLRLVNDPCKIYDFGLTRIDLNVTSGDFRRTAKRPAAVGKSCAHACHVTEALVAYLRQ